MRPHLPLLRGPVKCNRHLEAAFWSLLRLQSRPADHLCLQDINTVPWFPFTVIQPMVPSFSARARMRKTPRSFSRVGPSSTSTVSPTSILRRVCAPFTRRLSWITVVLLHLYCGDHGLRLFSRIVTQPTAPSLSALAFTRTTASKRSSLGPSNTSMASSAASTRSSSAPSLAKRFCSGVSCCRVKSLLVSSAYTVPALPLSVTQPSVWSFRDRPLTRKTPVPSSVQGPSNTFMTSLTSSFRSTLHCLMSRTSVMAMATVHVAYFPPASALTLPSLSFTVTHPTAPSLQQRAFTRRASPVLSLRGPSKTSRTSSCISERVAGAAPMRKSDSRGISVTQQRKGFGASFKNGVP
mmetsp:Transcript_72363/g.167674  ORF Transcript_72363/g.167674 Transcript_72363/m.167674 type:complete len:351 (-) Transcript_72363:435-1487(-)